MAFRINGSATGNSNEDTSVVANHKLQHWLENPPDLSEMLEVYDTYAYIKAAIIRKKREIKVVEDEISLEIDRPRSNEAKRAKMQATKSLEDDLAGLEEEFVYAEIAVKKIEFRKSMYQNATYTIKQQFS